MDKIKVAIIVGTAREKRRSVLAANFVQKTLREFEEIETIFVDPLDFNLHGDGNDDAERDPKYTKITEEANAFVIVTPEYNHGYPGSLKRLLDMEYKNYFHKPVILVGVSDGTIGGARAVELLIPVVAELGMIYVRGKIYFPVIQDLFNEKGEFIGDSKYVDKIKKATEELLFFVNSLQ